VKAPGSARRANGLASYGAVVTLLASVTLSLIPFSAPALADPPPPPVARDDTSRQREVERLRAVAEEQKRQVELQRNVQAMQARALQREVERQTEHARRASLSAEAGTRGDARRIDRSSFALTATSGEPVSLQACNASPSRQVIAPAASVVLIGKSWITKSRGLGEAYLRGTRVELSIGGVNVPNAERYFIAPSPFDHPVLGKVWITRWEYPLTITQTPIAVQVRWTLEHQIVDLTVFDEDGKPVHYAAGFSVALSCTLVSAVTLTGRITGEGTAISDGHVAAFPATGNSSVAGAAADANGEFVLLLPPGDYRLFFFSAGGPWLAEWWDDRKFSDATVVTVALGVSLPRFMVDLTRGVFVSGQVTDALTHAALPNVGVVAQDGCCEAFFGGTDGDGRYRMVVRTSVSYKVSFFPQPGPIPYLEQWWDERHSFNEADWLAVGTTDISGIDAALERGVFVRGRVTDAESAQGLANVSVSASVVSAMCCENFFAFTNAQGEYEMPVRTNVSIVLGFFPQPSPVPYVASYWNGRRSFSEADPLAVGVLDISGIDAALERGVFLRGRVTDATTGDGLFRASVVASVGTCCGESYFAQTAADGMYVAAVRKNVTLVVQFFGPFGGPYLQQWFSGRATRAEADPVPVTTADVTGIDAALERGVFLRGRVTEAGIGAPIALASVTVSPAASPCCDNSYASTDRNGDYAVVVRRHSSVKVAFYPPFGTREPYLPQWYQGKPTFETADPVSVVASDVLGIDAALERGVFVRGRVTDAVTLGPIQGAGILALDLAPPCCAGTFASTDSRGEYRVVARTNAALKINFSPPFGGAVPYIGQWYNAKTSFNEADVVPVGSADVLGIDAALERGVFVRGRVTDAVSGDGIAGVGVNAQRVDVDCCETFFVSTDAEGRYAMTLKPGISVKVFFIRSFNDPVPHLSEWWNDRRTFSEADTLAIGTTDVGDIDAALDLGVFVRGHVTKAENGQDLAQVNVNAFPVDGPCCENFFAITDANGDYAMVVRPNVDVKVNFFPPFGTDLLPEYYNNKRDFGSADVVHVLEASLSGIDAALERGVFLRGRVTDEVGAGLAQASAVASVQGGPCCESFWASTDTAGDYAMVVRPNIDVKVTFYPPFGTDLLVEHYDNKTDYGSADVVHVGETPVSGISAMLERGVRLSGTVRDAADAAISGVGVQVETETCCGFVAYVQTATDGSYTHVLRPGRYKVVFFPPFGSDLLVEYYDDQPNSSTADVIVVGAAPVTGIDAVLEPSQALIVDARVAQNIATTDFIERDDAFTLRFSTTMDAGTTGDTLRIEDQDGTAVTLRCGVAPNNVRCDWDADGMTVTILVVDGLVLPAFDSGDFGTTPGLQIPFNIVTLTGFADANGNAPNVLGSPDHLVDYE